MLVLGHDYDDCDDDDDDDDDCDGGIWLGRVGEKGRKEKKIVTWKFSFFSF